MITRVASVVRVRSIILVRICHFGTKRVSRVRLLSEKIVSMRTDYRCGEIVHKVPISFILVVE